MAAIVGYLSDLYMASGTPVAFATEAMTDSGDHQTYHAGTAAHRYWDDGSAVTVEVSTDGGSTWNAAAAGTFTIQYVGGVVTFTTVNANRDVRASGKYLAITQVGQAYDWELTPTADRRGL